MNQITYNHLMEAYTSEEWAEFAFFSANVQHVLDEHDLRTQLDLYHRYLDYVEWQAGLDLHEGTAVACSPALQQGMEQGGMLVTFHYGQYRLIPLSLMAMGYRVCILVSRDVSTEQREYYWTHLPAAWFANLVFVVAEDPRLFFRLRQYRQDGYILLCYADGAVGAKKATTSSGTGLTEVRLGHATIAARSGFAAMAYLLRSPIAFLQAPLAPMSQDWILDCLAVYHPIQYRSRTDFVEQVMIGMYQQLSLALSAYPECWECWTHLHERMPIYTSLVNWAPESRYIPFQHKGHNGLLDKAFYTVYPVDDIKYLHVKQAVAIAY